MKTCASCGNQFTPTRKDRIYCSKHCAKIASEKTKAPRVCSDCGQLKKLIARNLCHNCYMRWHNEHRATHYDLTCRVCGNHFTSRSQDTTVCSRKCASDLALQSDSYKQHLAWQTSSEGRLAQSERMNHYWEDKPRKPKPVPLTAEQKHQRWISRLSPLHKAWELKDSAGFFKTLKANCHVDEAGCWNWQGNLKNGYAYITWSNKTLAVYRLSLEMRYGKPLGSQAAHHQCGNSQCVNPNHLQPVTAYDNNAEMLARKAYEDRISELEDYIRSKEPNAEILNRISYQRTRYGEGKA